MAQRCLIGDRRFCLPDQVDLEYVLKFSDRVNITDRIFDIKDVNGNLVFRVKEPEYRLNGKKTLLDVSGSPILTCKPVWPWFFIHTNWRVYSGVSEEQRDLLYTVQLKAIWQLDVFLNGNEEQRICDFRVKASRYQFSRSCVIYAGESDVIVAQMHQNISPTNVISGTDNISVTVNPNVDHAFIATLVVIMDDVIWTYFDKLRITGRVFTMAGSAIIQPFDIMRKIFSS